MKNVFSKVIIYSVLVASILLLTLNKRREVTAFTLNIHNMQNNNGLRTPRIINTGRTTQITSPFVLKSTTQNGVNGEANVRNKKINTFKASMPEHDDHGPVQPITSIASFLDAIESAPRNSIVVVQ